MAVAAMEMAAQPSGATNNSNSHIIHSRTVSLNRTEVDSKVPVVVVEDTDRDMAAMRDNMTIQVTQRRIKRVVAMVVRTVVVMEELVVIRRPVVWTIMVRLAVITAVNRLVVITISKAVMMIEVVVDMERQGVMVSVYLLIIHNI